MRYLSFLVFVSIFISCHKDPDPVTPPPPPAGILPTVTTSAVSSVTTTSAISGGNVSANGSSAVTERGVCWDITSNPVVTGNHTVDGSGTGIFTSNVNGLSPNTTYYLRAYAKNTQGVAYGNEVLFQTILPLPPGDTANQIFVTASSSSTGRSFLGYDKFKTKMWEITNFPSVSFWNTPVYENGKLYVASNASMLSLNAINGAVNWTYTNPNSLLNPKLKNDTIITAGSQIAPSANNAILLINKNTGNVIWSKVVTDQPVNTPTLIDGKVLCLTVNSTGTSMSLSAYDLVTKNLIWQKVVSGSFFTAVPPDMIVRNDSLIVFTASVLCLNKNTGASYWSAPLGTTDVHMYKNNLAFHDKNSGTVKILSLQTGNIILQSNPVTFTTVFTGVTYIYNDALYNNVADSVYCTSLIDGSLKWRKMYQTYAAPGSFKKFINVGNTVYGSRQFYNSNDESKLMILNAMDFTARDSMIIPKRNLDNFSILSSGGQFFRPTKNH